MCGMHFFCAIAIVVVVVIMDASSSGRYIIVLLFLRCSARTSNDFSLDFQESKNQQTTNETKFKLVCTHSFQLIKKRKRHLVYFWVQYKKFIRSIAEMQKAEGRESAIEKDKNHTHTHKMKHIQTPM